MATVSASGLTKVFVSYSHKDRRYLERLQTHLIPCTRTGEIDLWDDTKIEPGSNWREEIIRAIDSAKIAILLVSADFLASDFIVKKELPPLLTAAAQKGAIILPVILSPCDLLHSGLAQFQAVNKPSKPLISMTMAQREEIWVRVANHVRYMGAEDITRKVVKEVLTEAINLDTLSNCLLDLTKNQLYSLFTFLTIGQNRSVSFSKRALLQEILKIVNENVSLVNKIRRFAEQQELANVLGCLSDKY